MYYDIIAYIIIGAAFILAARHIYREFTRPQKSCSCSGCTKNCAYKGQGKPIKKCNETEEKKEIQLK